MRQNATVPIWNGEMWIYRPYVDGAQKKYTSRKPNKAGESEVRRKYSNALAGNDPSKVRIDKAWPDYLADKASRVGVKSGCYIMAESVGRVQILPRLKNRKVSSITEQDWQDVIYKAKPIHKSKAVLSKKYLMNIRGEIKMFCRYAKKKGYIAERPEDLDIPKTAPTIGKQILQTDALRGFLSDSGSDWYIHLWQLMATSGLRPGEAYGLQRADVENGLITVKRSINKSGTITPGKNENAPRTFVQKPIDSDIIFKQLAMLSENKILSPWLFCDEDGMKPNPIVISHRWDEYRKRFPYRVTQYGLRHTFVSHNQNVLPDALMKLLVGHSPKTPTGELYGHFVTGDDVQAAKIVSGVFDKIMSKSSIN